jgi:hypothetical protein
VLRLCILVACHSDERFGWLLRPNAINTFLTAMRLEILP